MFAEKIIQISKKISPKGLPLNTVLKRLQISRSSFYYQRKKKINSEEKLLRERIKELAMTYKTYGYKKITVLLRKEGFKVNHKKVYRIWKEEGFNRYAIF